MRLLYLYFLGLPFKPHFVYTPYRHVCDTYTLKRAPPINPKEDHKCTMYNVLRTKPPRGFTDLPGEYGNSSRKTAYINPELSRENSFP